MLKRYKFLVEIMLEPTRDELELKFRELKTRAIKNK
jgi:hypothetical protein